eukprot:4177965-Prymnesium_polylepis.1
MIEGLSSPARPRNVGARSTCVPGASNVDPGRMPGPRARRWILLEAVIGRVEEVGAIELPQLLDRPDHVADEVVDGHEGAPTVLEDGRDDVGGLVRQHRRRSDVAVVALPAVRGAVPVLGPRLVLGPRVIPVVEVPRCRDERLVRRLGRDVGKPRLRTGRHRLDPGDRGVAHHGRRVVIGRALPASIGLARNVLRLELGCNVISAAVGEPGVEPLWNGVRHCSNRGRANKLNRAGPHVRVRSASHSLSLRYLPKSPTV